MNQKQPIFTEDFSAASGSLPPPGWKVEVLEGNPETDLWLFDNPGERPFLEFNDSFDGPFAVYDSDALSDDGVAESLVLESPVFDASDSEEIYLLFDQYYGGIAEGENASQIYVEASNDGTNWEQVYFSDTDEILTVALTINLTEELAGEENAQIRFRFDGNWSFLWALDNIEIGDAPGIKEPTQLVGVSEDNVPDPLNLTYLRDNLC